MQALLPLEAPRLLLRHAHDSDLAPFAALNAEREAAAFAQPALNAEREAATFAQPALPPGHRLRTHCLDRVTRAEWLEREGITP